MYDFFLIFSAIVFLIMAAISDIRSREISNKLILFFLILGIAFKLFLAIITKDFEIITFLFISFLICLILFFLLWEFGVIAGGDLKLFLVLAVLTPKLILPYNLSLYFFTLFVFIVSLFMLFPWILLFSSYHIFKKKLYVAIFKETFTRQNLISLFESFLVVFLMALLFSIFSSINTIFLILLSIVFSLLIFKIKHKKLFYLILGFIYLLTILVLFIKTRLVNLSLMQALEIIVFLFIFSILKSIYKVVKEKILIEEKKISNLKEGDLPVYNYYYKNKKLTLIKPTTFTKIKMLVTGTYYLNLKIDSSKSCGLVNKDILFLKTMYKNNLISNKIYLRKTLAFVPAVLLGYILLILI